VKEEGTAGGKGQKERTFVWSKKGVKNEGNENTGLTGN